MTQVFVLKCRADRKALLSGKSGRTALPAVANVATEITPMVNARPSPVRASRETSWVPEKRVFIGKPAPLQVVRVKTGGPCPKIIVYHTCKA